MNIYGFILFTTTLLLVSTCATPYEDHAPSPYKFAYGVSDHHTGDHHQQHEISDGHVVRGSYSLKEADGTTRIVKYVAGPHSGFNAVVQRIGHAHHPQHYKTYGKQNWYNNVNEGGHGGYNYYYGGHGEAESYVGTTHWGYNNY